MVRGLFFLLLAVLLAVLLYCWPWLYRETIFPVLDVAGYVLKAWAPLLMTLLGLGALFLIARHTFLR